MILDNLHIDNYLKFEHSEINNSTADDNTLIGATKSTDRTLDFTPDDTNSVYVSKAGNDTTGDGTAANPYLTIKQANTAVTATKCNIVIADSGTYVEEDIIIDTDCARIVAAIGFTPSIVPTDFADCTVTDNIDATSLGVSTNGSARQKSDVSALSNGNFVIAYTVAGTVYFMIVDKNNNVIVSGTSSELIGDSTTAPNLCTMDDGFVIGSHNNASIAYAKVYSNAGVLQYTLSQGSARNGLVSNFGSNSNHFAFIWGGASGTSIKVCHYDGTEIIAPTLFTTKIMQDTGSGYGVSADPNGGLVYVFKTYGVASMFWGIIDATATLVYTEEIALPGISAPSGTLIGNKFVIAWTYYYTTANAGKLQILEYDITTHALSKAQVTFATLASTYADSIDVEYIGDGNIAITGAYENGYLYILNCDWDILFSETYTGANYVRNAYNSESKALFITYTGMTDPYYYYALSKDIDFREIWTSADRVLLTVSAPIYFNGLTFSKIINDKTYVSTSGSSLAFYSCNIKSSDYNYGDSDVSPIISTATTNIFSQCQLYDYNCDIDITSNNVNIAQCIIYNTAFNPAFKITGSGANIIFNHNTVFNCQIGLELVSNAGTEVIKNSIFSNNQTAIKAETSVLIKNCCVPDPLDNATYDSTSSTLNPLFISDGYVTAMDLHLQSKVLNYAFDSPALGIADDSKDAGCYDVTYTLNPASYTSFVIPKPKTIIPNINTVNKIVNVMQDGSVDVQVDAYQLEISLEWDSILKRYVNSIIKLFMAEGDIRIYFNPATYPTIYEEMKLVTKELPLNSDTYTLTDSGFNKFKLEFVRKFQLSELVV